MVPKFDEPEPAKRKVYKIVQGDAMDLAKSTLGVGVRLWLTSGEKLPYKRSTQQVIRQELCAHFHVKDADLVLDRFRLNDGIEFEAQMRVVYGKTLDLKKRTADTFDNPEKFEAKMNAGFKGVRHVSSVRFRVTHILNDDRRGQRPLKMKMFPSENKEISNMRERLKQIDQKKQDVLTLQIAELSHFRAEKKAGRGWLCQACQNKNATYSLKCSNCLRPSSYGPKSMACTTEAAPLPAHGDGPATLKAEQVYTMVENGWDPDQADQFGNTGLHHAAKWSRGALVNALVESGANIEAANEDGRRPLHTAAEVGAADIVKLLISYECEMDPATKSSGETPLHLAAIHGHAAAATALLLNGADPAAVSAHSRQNALHLACDGGHTAVVKTLLEFDADPNVQDKDGWTALAHAQFKNHPATERFMKDHGAKDGGWNDSVFKSVQQTSGWAVGEHSLPG